MALASRARLSSFVLWSGAFGIFLLTAQPIRAVTPLQIEHDVNVASMLSDRFTWYDSAGQPRVAVLAHNDAGAGPGGAQGGALREFRYQLADGSTRIATVTTYGNAGYAGFGYVVGHASNYVGCVGDDSPLGGFIAGHWSRIFEGRHHVIFRFTQDYPRNCSTTAPVQARTIPVTMEWVFATGRDNPLWGITWNIDQTSPAAPANTFFDDSRAPYGELNIDGAGWTDIDGVAWGDRYKFTSTTAPVTLDSTWTWNVPNSVPYVKEWLNGPLQPDHTRDATIGIVQTQTMTQQDAGGGRDPNYHDMTQFWGKTSANGDAGDGYKMPWQGEWPYQANAFNLGTGAGGSNNNARMTWRTQWGFIGQSSYVVNDGVVANAPGYPKKSYSTYIVLGPHSTLPVEAQVAQVETVQSLTLSASVGSVVTSGPAGVGRSDTVTYAPSGYNHVYGALAFQAAGNQLDANIAVGSGTLKKPMVIVGSFTGTYPTSVKLGGVTLTADVDYFASLRPSASELWLTLNRDLTGATNHLQIAGSAGVAGAKFYVLTPCRLLDTRGGGAVAATGTRNIVVAGGCGVPSGVTGIASNVTVVSPSDTAYVTLYPGGSARPFASSLNYTPGRTLANNANITVGPDGSINVFNSGSQPLDVLIDVNGYFK